MPENSASNTGIPLDPVIPSASAPDASFVARLFDSERHHMPHPDYRLQLFRDLPIHLTARQDSINWILKVHAHYHFKPVTAFLSINYFDRFLSFHSLPFSGWPLQLLSVACLSLAAKMEEPNVPLLMDLQLFDPKYLFEPKTIQRMELRVMDALNWRLRCVTPFDYLDYFISEITIPRSSDPRNRFSHIIPTFSDFTLNTTRVTDFLGFAPSVIAASAVITAVGDSMDIPESFYDRVNKEMVRCCHQLMQESLVETCPKMGGIEEPPDRNSPSGVLDATACGSCDTRSEDPVPVSAASYVAAPMAGAEPPSRIKRLKSSAADKQEAQE